MGVRIGIRELRDKSHPTWNQLFLSRSPAMGRPWDGPKVTRAQYKLSIYLSQVVPVSVE